MRIEIPETIAPAEELGRVHFIGIGGAGLSAIARVMAGRGVPVSGSDAQASSVIEALQREGIDARVGHHPDGLDEVDTVIASTAIHDDNPEVVAARARGLRLWPRSAGLQSVLCTNTAIAVAGTHGKTTTTSMLTLALRAAGHDVSFAIGAEVPALGTNAQAGSDDLFVVEADESDGAFLVYTPTGALITNIDADHLDQWGSEEAYREAFGQFAGRVSDFVVVCADDPDAVSLVRDRATARVRSAGFAADADVRGENLRMDGGRTLVDIVVDGTPSGTMTLGVPGQHYATDALLALAGGLELGADINQLIAGLAEYTGADRRMQRVGEAAGVRVYDTYAHHPVEIRADLAAARDLAGSGRVIVVFQPHLVSRTRIFGTAMGEALSAADIVGVVDIYLAREAADPQVTRTVITEAIVGAEVLDVSDLDDVAAAIAAVAQPGDLVVTMGAGDITSVAPRIVEQVSAVD